MAVKRFDPEDWGGLHMEQTADGGWVLFGDYEELAARKRTHEAKTIEYQFSEKGSVLVNELQPPFNGDPVLIRIATGWVEAYWLTSKTRQGLEGTDYEGFHWVCLDDSLNAEFDEATHWCELPC